MSVEEFILWNEEMIRRYNPDAFHHHPNWIVRFIEAMRVRKILDMLEIKNGDRILEVGCGCGNILSRISAGRLFGMDISEFAVRHSMALLRGRAEIVKGDAERLPFGDGSFTKVYCSEVLEHVLHPAKALEEMKRVAGKDGLWVVSIPNEKGIDRIKTFLVRAKLFSFFLKRDRYQSAEKMTDEWHLHRFDLDYLKKILPAGLRIEKVAAVPSFLLPLRYVAALRAEPV